nr:ROK family protein [Spiroplasma clarkii]
MEVIPKTNNLQGWEGVNLVAAFKAVFAIKVVVNNDANFAALGQAIVKNKQDLVFLTISTGIGCGIIINQKFIKVLQELLVKLQIQWWQQLEKNLIAIVMESSF